MAGPHGVKSFLTRPQVGVELYWKVSYLASFRECCISCTSHKLGRSSTDIARGVFGLLAAVRFLLSLEGFLDLIGALEMDAWMGLDVDWWRP